MLTAKDLLYKAMDYDGFWSSSKRMRNSKPSQCRKIQLDKLLVAFGINKHNGHATAQAPGKKDPGKTVRTVYAISKYPKGLHRVEYIRTLSNLEYLITGEFIADISRGKYNDLIAQIITEARRIFPEQTNFIDNNPINLVRLFHFLYNFRSSLYYVNLYVFNRKTNNYFSTEEDYYIYLRKKFISNMEADFAEIDELLCLLIDPEKKTFNEEELDYPYYNFEVLDEEWENDLRKQNPFQ